MSDEQRMGAITQKLQHLKYLSKLFTSVLPGSRSERWLKLKLEKEMQGLKELQVDAGIVFMVLGETGNLLNLPMNLEWRKPQGKQIHLP